LGICWADAKETAAQRYISTSTQAAGRSLRNLFMTILMVSSGDGNGLNPVSTTGSRSKRVRRRQFSQLANDRIYDGSARRAEELYRMPPGYLERWRHYA